MINFCCLRMPVFLCLAMLCSPVLAEPCRDEVYDGNAYVVCSFDLTVSDIRMFWRNGDNEAYRTFSSLAADLAASGHSLVFAMNAGMYQADHSPLGLYIENGRTLKSANTTVIDGNPGQVPNFYKQPNGIFYIGAGAAGVMETHAFLSDRPESDYATQSGPMLVIDGVLHSAFIPDSAARNIRNGVGVSGSTKVHFAITRNRVNFHDFARFFRDGLGCDNALYLDGGSAPGIYVPALNRNDWPGHGGYGPIIAVVE